MNVDNLTERQIREKEYYEKYSQTFDLNRQIDLSPILKQMSGEEVRPWNSYWRTYQIPIEEYNKNKDPMLLDFGCGPGDNALRLANIGYKILGFDISESNVNTANSLFKLHQKEEVGNFVVSTAEKLIFDDESFDMVVGIDILHHVDIEKALLEVFRVLKLGGKAVFREPIEVPLLDTIRNSWIVRKLVPNEASLETHITVDERKLNKRDFEIMKKIFPQMTVERGLIFSRFDKFIRKENDKSASILEKIDYFLIKIFPLFGKLGGSAVIILKK